MLYITPRFATYSTVAKTRLFQLKFTVLISNHLFNTVSIHRMLFLLKNQGLMLLHVATAIFVYILCLVKRRVPCPQTSCAQTSLSNSQLVYIKDGINIILPF